MAVSQRFIDLLNMPLSALRRLAELRGVELPVGANKWTVAKAVARSGNRDELEADSDGYLYAGSTSLSWFRLIPEDPEVDEEDPENFYPLAGEPLNLDDVLEALRANADCDPFDEDDLPDNVTQRPTLVLAREWRDGVLMTFAVARRALQVIHNFELVDVYQDEFFSAFLRLADGTFEVRAGAARARTLHSDWLDNFAADLGLRALPVNITDDDVRAVRDIIGGRLEKYDGSEATGTRVIGTVRYKKADFCTDLFEEPEFAQQVDGYSAVAYDMRFDHDGKEDIHVHISPLRGSVFIRTAVPETVVRYMYDAMREAKT